MSAVTRTPRLLQKRFNRSASTKAAVNSKVTLDNYPQLKDSLAALQKWRHLNCFTFIASEESINVQLDQASQVADNPLKYQPIAIKDNFCVKDMPATCGSKMLANFQAPYNATVVQKLINAGAIIIGKTNMDEFGMGNGTIDSIWGATKNPWQFGSDPKGDFYVAGGSSGGSAAAVAAGITFGALGSDTGGSTRNPASYCGVIGLKPTYGLLSRHGLIPLVNSMDVPGLLTRRVDHCAQLFDLLKGHDPKDSTTLQMESPSTSTVPSPSGSVKNLVIGIPDDFHSPDISPEIIQCWHDTADLLANSGAQVKKCTLPHTKYSIVCYSVLNPCEVASNMARYDGLRYGHRAQKVKGQKNSTEALYAQTRHEGFNQVVRGRILAGNYFLLKDNYKKYFEQALKVRRLIKEDYDKLWKEGYHLILTPVTLTTAPKYGDFVKWDNRKQSSVQDYCTQPANMAGIPALSLPIKLSEENGLPLSLQLMGPGCSEKRLFEVGKFIENQVNFPYLK